MKNKAAFLDRDGVINKKREDYVKSLDEFEILDGVAESIKILKDNGFLVIVITNQSAIDRKLLSIKSLGVVKSFIDLFFGKIFSFHILIKISKFLSLREVKTALFSITESSIGVFKKIGSTAHCKLIVPNNLSK